MWEQGHSWRQIPQVKTAVLGGSNEKLAAPVRQACAGCRDWAKTLRRGTKSAECKSCKSVALGSHLTLMSFLKP